MEKNRKKSTRTILSSMEDVVSMAKEHSLSEKFYEEAEKSLKYLSKVLLLSKEEALLLSLFFEKSSSWRIRISDISEMINTSNIKIISMMNVADDLAAKGYLKAGNSKEERYFNVPMEVIDSIRRNVCYIPKPISNLTFDEFFDRLSDIFDEEDISSGTVRRNYANSFLPICICLIAKYHLHII